MQVRLAFSVAIRAKSDILVLDEVLAVGDEAFQRKCNDYFMNAKENRDKTIILVTHSMDAVRKYCNRAMLIDKGEIKVIGSPDEVANQYSLDNVYEVGSATVIEGQDESIDDSGKEKRLNPVADNIKVNLVSDKLMGNDRELSFDIAYSVFEDKATYIAFSLTDVDRNVWMYNDNSFDYPTNGTGDFSFRYTCILKDINQCKLQIVASIRTMDDQMVAIADSDNMPIVIVPPEKGLDHSAEDSSTGILRRNGIWNNNELKTS